MTEFKLILATSNKDKAREIAEILEGTPFVVTTMKEEGFDTDIVEDGKTFEETKTPDIRQLGGKLDKNDIKQSFRRAKNGIHKNL